MKVMKFGGTSLANWQRFNSAAQIVLASAAEQPTAVVLSAPATVTNGLLEMVDLAVAGDDFFPVLSQVHEVFKTLYGQAASEVLSGEQSDSLEAVLAAQLKHWQDKLQGVEIGRAHV